MPLTVGTAGHIDHGKTWLVRALTGKDTDRLPEEKARGISIDLGYAPLDLPDGRRLSVVDVPGHERFIHNMVAGASGIDLFLLVIDAAEGARPQTHEHLAILRLLGIDRGVVAVTKSDAVDEETLELAVEEARELVPGAAVVAVSAKTGAGLDELKAALAEAAGERERASGPARLYVDRVFTLHGIGTVATGTLWSGSIGAGDELRAEPSGLDVRVRSVEVHDAPVERAEAGQRVAVSLPGVERSELRRGDALVSRGAFRPSYRLDVALEPLAEIPSRVQLHHGTSQVVARVARAGEAYAQLRLSAPVVAARGDRVVLRTSTTVGGGRVLDPLPPRHSDPERMSRVERGDVAATIHAPVPRASVAHLLDGEPEVEQAGEWLYSAGWLEELRAGARPQARRSRPARSRNCPAARAVGAGDRPAARPGTARRQALPAGHERLAGRPRGGGGRARSGGRGGGVRTRRGRRRRRVPGARGPSLPRRRRLRRLARAVRARARGHPRAEPDHDRGGARPARRLPQGRASSCSSASTPTGSRVASATSVC